MEPSVSAVGTTQPRSWRLQRALTVALLLSLWAPVKIFWEQHIGQEQDLMRYRSVVVTRELRDQLGQGLTIGVLSGMRSVVADLVWLNTVTAWMNQQWFDLSKTVTLCTALQPRTPLFWDMGGWHLAWNASVGATENPNEKNELRRLKASRFWIGQGLDLFKRGLENNPTDYRLWLMTGQLYQQRMKDPRTAAYYYQKASEQPKAPIYLERVPAIMYGLVHDDPAAYEAWKTLWLRLTPAQREERQHAGDRLEKEIRQLENKLSIPPEKRIFPN